jgi:hypothetical protein
MTLPGIALLTLEGMAHLNKLTTMRRVHRCVARREVLGREKQKKASHSSKERELAIGPSANGPMASTSLV